MAEANDKKNQTQSTGQQSGQQRQSNQPLGQQSGAMQSRRRGQRGGGIIRRGLFAPSLFAPSMFALSPSAVFSMSPFELMRRFADELDRAFEDFGLARGPDFGLAEAERWAPPVEVFERDNNLVVRAELPGLSPEDVRVELTDDGLVIEGERRREHEERLEGGYRSELVYGHFYRLIPMPEGVNADQTQARINNGVLEVKIPMVEQRRQRRSIPISGAIGTGDGQEAQTAGGQAQTATGGSGRQ